MLKISLTNWTIEEVNMTMNQNMLGVEDFDHFQQERMKYFTYISIIIIKTSTRQKEMCWLRNMSNTCLRIELIKMTQIQTYYRLKWCLSTSDK
jgi:hypothetical protein